MQEKPPDPHAGRARRPRARRADPVAPVVAGPPPVAGSLRDAALAHLARFAATEAGLVRVLDRRIQRWSRRAAEAGDPPDQIVAHVAAARLAARTVAAALVAGGVVDDTAYAQSKARSLTRAGRSRRAIGAHLSARGVELQLARASLPDDAETELAAAVLQARRRRIGPFTRAADRDEDAPDDPLARNRALAALARAGFGRDVAERALSLELEEAERLIHALKQL